MNLYSIFKKNNYLKTDKEIKNLLKNKEFHLYGNFGKDENFVVYTPYIPIFESSLMPNL
jgi:hypothetical protein